MSVKSLKITCVNDLEKLINNTKDKNEIKGDQKESKNDVKEPIKKMRKLTEDAFVMFIFLCFITLIYNVHKS